MCLGAVFARQWKDHMVNWQTPVGTRAIRYYSEKEDVELWTLDSVHKNPSVTVFMNQAVNSPAQNWNQ